MQAARTRARRRLIGAAVLLGAAIVGFPWLFETQPRPIAVDIPIEVARREGSPALTAPVAKGGTHAAVPPAPPASAPNAAERPGERDRDRTAEAPVEPASAVAAAPVAASAPARGPAAPASAAAASRPAPAMADAQRDAQRAQALLDGKPVASASTAVVAAAPVDGAAASEPKAARYVVQAGAYTDSGALRDARQKVEKLGMKTYTQVIDTESGPRTRVRVGPFATRDEADKAAARIKGSGLAANVLSL